MSTRTTKAPDNRTPAILGFVCGFAVATGVGLVAWSVRPQTNWERIAGQNSPEFMLAAFDSQGRPPVDPENISRYRQMLNNATEFYKDAERIVADEVVFVTASLNEKGHATEAFMVLNGSIKAAKKTSERQGGGFKKIGYRSFASIYQAFREDGLTHRKAIEKIIEFEKL